MLLLPTANLAFPQLNPSRRPMPRGQTNIIELPFSAQRRGSRGVRYNPWSGNEGME